MSEDRPPPLAADDVQAMIGRLEAAGFFRQIGELEQALKQIAGDLRRLGDATVPGRGDTESLNAHIVALEAAVAVLMRTLPADVETFGADRPPHGGAGGFA